MYIELSVEYCVEATMECKLCWEVILLLVCVRSSLRVCAAEVSNSLEVHISKDGVVTWEVQNKTQSPLYFIVGVVGLGQRASYHNSITVSVKYYDLNVLNLSPGDYSIQIQVVSEQGIPSAAYFSTPQTYTVKGGGVSKENLIFVILPVIIVVGLLLGVMLLLCTVKTKSDIFACYQTQSQTKNKSNHQRVSFTRQRAPVHFDKNESYHKHCHNDNNHESFHTSSNNNISGNENEYAYIDSSSQSPLQELPHLYDALTHHHHSALSSGHTELEVASVADVTHIQTNRTHTNTTTCTAEVHHTIIVGHETRSSNVEQDNQTLNEHSLVNPVVQCTQVRDSSDQSSTLEAHKNENDQYIEVYHDRGTLI